MSHHPFDENDLARDLVPMTRVNGPSDWDGQSYCIEGDGQPATHRRLDGMIDDTPVYELVCCDHARHREARQR